MRTIIQHPDDMSVGIAASYVMGSLSRASHVSDFLRVLDLGRQEFPCWFREATVVKRPDAVNSFVVEWKAESKRRRNTYEGGKP